MDYFTWALILLGIGLLCLVLEFFIPSSGMLGLMCVLSLVGAIVLGFMSGTTTGAAMLLGDEVLPETHTYRGLRELVGKRGTAKSLMLPGGIVQVEGKNYDAISEGTPIEAGQRILVVQISTQRLVVRVDDSPFEEATQPQRTELAHSMPLEAPPPADIADPFAE